ncbi:unnamed protein product [Colias eurytheme]|nr:unnamed protein product [Colias eurytheme]
MYKFSTVVGTLALLYFLDTNANMDGGPGLWYVFSVEDCHEELELVLMNVTVKKHKLNRTHDVYDALLDVHDTLGNGDGVLLDICKHTDGGCKQVHLVTDNDVGEFAEKYAKKNMEAAFTLAGMDPPRFPVSPGSYDVRDFYFDRCEMPHDAVYGEFTALAYVTRGAQRVACIRVHVEFKDEEDNECVYDDE